MSQANRPAGVPDNLPVLTEVVEYVDDAPTTADEPLALEMPAELTLDELLPPPPAAAVFETLPSLDLDIPGPLEALSDNAVPALSEEAPQASRWSEPVVSPEAWQATPADELFASPWVAAPRTQPAADSTEPPVEMLAEAGIPELSLDDLLFEADGPAGEQASGAAAEMAAAWAQLAPVSAVSPEPELVSGLEPRPAEAAGDLPLDELLGELAWPQAAAAAVEPGLAIPEEMVPTATDHAFMPAPAFGGEGAVSGQTLAANLPQGSGFAGHDPAEMVLSPDPLDAAQGAGAAPAGRQPDALPVAADAAEAASVAGWADQALAQADVFASAEPVAPPVSWVHETASDGQAVDSAPLEAPSAIPAEPEPAVQDLVEVHADAAAVGSVAEPASDGAWTEFTGVAVPAGPESAPSVPGIALTGAAEAGLASSAAAQSEAAADESFASPAEGSLPELLAPAAGVEPVVEVSAIDANAGLAVMPDGLAEPVQPFGVAAGAVDVPAVHPGPEVVDARLPASLDACAGQQAAESADAAPSAGVAEGDELFEAQPDAAMAVIAAAASVHAVDAGKVSAENPAVPAQPVPAQEALALAGAVAAAGVALQAGAETEAAEQAALLPQGAAGERVAVVDEAALLEAIYQRILPRMRVELSLWLQDAIENQTRHLLAGVMQQMREDYDMLFGETLRESIRQAISDIETNHKDEQ
ncbi:hypothetical protein [Crenobacter caeni]|uniref:DUF2486 family protein n=1 Tax=Crenobacter caeni TaxID=2705474 RepID=A0A6B2KQ36_9NEIS|nr:hypothetical protein [Crenobacter caeni]NDV12346.1 hypothetical protein [Crenobacter caeni]